MGIKVDFSGVGEFEPLPSATYPVVITNVEQKDSARSEFPYLNWTLCVTEGEFEDRKLWLITTLNPKGFFKLQELLIACGMKKEDLNAEFELEPENFIGCEFVVTVTQDTYNGRLVNVIQACNPTNVSIKGPGKVPSSSGVKGAKGPRIR